MARALSGLWREARARLGMGKGRTMTYVIRKANGSQTRPVYQSETDVIAALNRTRQTGAQAWWCKYGRETKMLVATKTACGIDRFLP